MGRRLLKISYMGTAYCGWQVQPNGITVQSVLQDALLKILGERPDVVGCSRTDSGVHAREFCLHFDTEKNIDNEGLCLGLNTALPDDIAAVACYNVADDFHARYLSTGKTYTYKMYFSKIRDPFLEGRSLRLKWDLDLERAREFCSLMLGTHNFEAFSSVHRSVKNTVRTVSYCDISKCNEGYTFTVRADGFLYNMVRIMVGSMLWYSYEKISKSDIISAFDTGIRSSLGITAPPYGLYLEKVHYPENIIKGR